MDQMEVGGLVVVVVVSLVLLSVFVLDVNDRREVTHLSRTLDRKSGLLTTIDMTVVCVLQLLVEMLLDFLGALELLILLHLI